MRTIAMIAALAVAAAVSAAELTVNEVIAAQRAGAPVEGILRLVREAPTVAVLAASDLERMRAAGVPEAVLQAMAARNAPPSPTPTAPATRPDDPRLEDVVHLVGAGLSATLVCDQIRRSGQRYAPSANDLVYLKEHGVPEAVMATLVASSSPPSAPAPVAPALATPTPLPAAPPAVALAFEPLVRLAGTFRKAQAGRLVLTADALEWSDAANPAQVVRVATAALQSVWLATAPRSQGAPLVELRVLTSAGDDLTFRDVDGGAPESGRVDALYRALKERFPQVVLPEKPVR